MSDDDKYFTPLDMELQKLAMIDWPTFVKLIGEDAVTAAKVCMLKHKGKSLNQIANKLTLTVMQVRRRGDRCEC